MFLDDLRHAIRRVRSRPATTLTAVAMLAVGIGLTTAMFTLADTLLLRPVPFRDPERLSQVSMMSPRGGRIAVAPAVFRAWRGTTAFEAVESASTGTALAETDTGPVALPIATVTPGLFRMLDVRPIRGRLFDASDGRAGADDRVLISEDVWRSTFGTDPQIVGRSIVIDRQPVVVVGVLPADFRFPRWDTVVWRPIDFDALPPGRTTELPTAFVRFAPGIPESDALRVATDTARAADPSTAALSARPRAFAGLVLNEYYSRAVPMLFGGAALVFLVLCANVSGLLLVRLSERRREFGMCTALGASRGRLLGQALVESALLGIAGCVCGILLGWALVATARGFLPEAFLLRTLNPLNLDVRALAAASVSGVLATLAAGVMPAWLGTRLDPVESMRVGDRTGTETRGTRSATRALLIAEIALACTLLAGAVLLVRSFANLAGTDRGLDSRGVVIASISLPATTFADRESRAAMIETIEGEMRRLPGVQRVALSFGLPPDGGQISFGDGWRSDLPGAPNLDMEVQSYDVGPDFFELYGIPLLRGRTFQPGDTASEVIVGERLAERFWPGMDPIGRSFTFDKQIHHVIGLVGEIHHPQIEARRDRPEYYRPVPAARLSGTLFMASLRCGDACPDGALIRQRLMATSPAIRVNNVGPLEAEYFEQLAAPRAAAALALVFSGVAVIAAAGGLFSMLSYAVGRRRREFGIRSALGATRSQIRGLVLGDGLLVGAIGLGLGSAAGWSLARALASFEFGVTGSDPLSWAGVVVLLALITLGAAWLPARQAARVELVTLLRDE